MEVERRACFIMNNPRGRFTSAASYKPSNTKMYMKWKFKKEKRNCICFSIFFLLLLVHSQQSSNFNQKNALPNLFLQHHRQKKNVDIKLLFFHLFVAIIKNRVIGSRPTHRQREGIKFLDYIKIENNDLDGRICLLSGLLRMIEGLQAHILWNTHNRNQSSARSVWLRAIRCAPHFYTEWVFMRARRRCLWQKQPEEHKGVFIEMRQLVSDANILYVLSVRAGAVISCHGGVKGSGRHIHCCHQSWIKGKQKHLGW